MCYIKANVGIMCLISIAIILTYISAAGGVTTVTVKITPNQLHFRTNKKISGKIKCQATQPISACEFKLFTLIDGKLTQDQNYIYEMKPELTGRDCTITVYANILWENYNNIATCRVRSANSDWSYASMSVYKSNIEGIHLNNTAYELVVLPGSRLDVAVRGSTTLASCSIMGPRQKARVYPFYTTQHYFRDVCNQSPMYYGRGEGACGQTCGITYPTATEEHNGILALVLASPNNRDTTFVSVIVAKPPNAMTLYHELVDDADGSVTLQANCTVSGGRPAPLITWYLAGEVVPAESTRSVVSEQWVWPFEEQTVQQTLTMTLDDSHAGQEVRCAATHAKLNVTLCNAFKIRHSSTTPTVRPPSAPPTPPTTEMFTDDISATAPTTALTATTNQSTASVTTPDTVGPSEKLGEDSKCEVIDRKAVTALYVAVGVLASLLVLVIVVVIVYARRKELCCFSGPKDSAGSVQYRRSVDACVKFEETRSPTTSSIDRSSAVTGMEYAEIRVSMVQRCVDKLADSPRALSAETGETSEDPIRPNSLYLGYDEKV